MRFSSEELDELADLLVDRLLERLQVFDPSAKQLVDIYALSNAVDLSVPTINRAVKAGKIPSIRAGGRRLFCISEVIRAIRAAGSELTKDQRQSINRK